MSVDLALQHLVYNYVPTEWICALFVALFSLSTLLHVGEATYFRMYWLYATIVLAGVAEVIGWSGRLWSSKQPFLLTPYLMQITTTIIAPTFLVAANFIILGDLIKRLGTQYSRISPRLYAMVFISADVLALIIQAVGGAAASHAVQTGKKATTGGHVMLAGIVFQLVAITIYVTLASEFVFRYLFNWPLRRLASVSSSDKPSSSSPQTSEESVDIGSGDLNRNLKLMLAGLSFSTVCIFIRTVYRTIELANGWTGRIIATQHYFNWLDGGMICLAMLVLNLLHPGYLLQSPSTSREKAVDV